MATFLSCCSRNLLHRTSAERKATRDNVVQRIQGSRTTTAVAPTEHRLTEQWIESIVCKLYGLAEYSLYSKSFKYSHEVSVGIVCTTVRILIIIFKAANCIGNLCAILPEMIVPKVVSTAQDDFMSVTMPHRTKASLKALNVICPVICDVQMYSQGKVTLIFSPTWYRME